MDITIEPSLEQGDNLQQTAKPKKIHAANGASKQSSSDKALSEVAIIRDRKGRRRKGPQPASPLVEQASKPSLGQKGKQQQLEQQTGEYLADAEQPQNLKAAGKKRDVHSLTR